ncbi:MAG: hypothetical protein AABX39_06370 [Nanoarchaeota archaeon]
MLNPAERDEKVTILKKNIRNKKPELEKLLEECNNYFYEDKFYRFYHQSFKVYSLQGMTERIVNEFKSLLPDRELNNWFAQIVSEGTGKKFDLPHNQRWLEETRPIVEAFSHSKYFLEMMLKYEKDMDSFDKFMPSGWAAVLYLYDLRY